LSPAVSTCLVPGGRDAAHEAACLISCTHQCGRVCADGAACFDGNAREACCLRLRDRIGADGRQIEPPVLAGLRRLDQHARAGRELDPSAFAHLGNPSEHGCRPFGCFHCNYVPVCNHRSLTDIERANRRQ
jgi:hypothetical protein